MEEGTLKTHYFITDHLGSIRTVFDKNGVTLGTNDSYPYRLSWNEGNEAGRYLFGGKESQKMFGFNYQDFHARFFDNKYTMGMLQLDPKTEDLTLYSPYIYSLNNPVNLVDPDGRNPLAWWLVRDAVKAAGIVIGSAAAVVTGKAVGDVIKETDFGQYAGAKPVRKSMHAVGAAGYGAGVMAAAVDHEWGKREQDRRDRRGQEESAGIARAHQQLVEEIPGGFGDYGGGNGPKFNPNLPPYIGIPSAIGLGVLIIKDLKEQMEEHRQNLEAQKEAHKQLLEEQEKLKMIESIMSQFKNPTD